MHGKEHQRPSDDEVSHAFLLELVSPTESALETAKCMEWTRNCHLAPGARNKELNTKYHQKCMGLQQRLFMTNITPIASSKALQSGVSWYRFALWILRDTLWPSNHRRKPSKIAQWMVMGNNKRALALTLLSSANFTPVGRDTRSWNGFPSTFPPSPGCRTLRNWDDVQCLLICFCTTCSSSCRAPLKAGKRSRFRKSTSSGTKLLTKGSVRKSKCRGIPVLLAIRQTSRWCITWSSVKKVWYVFSDERHCNCGLDSSCFCVTWDEKKSQFLSIWDTGFCSSCLDKFRC